MSTLVELDGSEGEGGGQILRTALSLALLTQRPFKLVNIRANRPKPGLAPQHLACVRAAAAISHAQYKGGSVGSSVLYFEPGPVSSGEYEFHIGTAGATGLVLHTLYLPLSLQGKSTSRLRITGGTHVPHSPCFHFNQVTWAGHLQRMGIRVQTEMVKPGFYPRGGGEIVATIEPCTQVRPLNLQHCPELTTAGGFSACADLPESINKRQLRRMTHKLKQAGLESHIEAEMWNNGPSTVAAVLFRQLPVPPLFFALGERGKPAESVADEAVEQAVAFRDSHCPVDLHSGDQLILPLVFAGGESVLGVSEVTRHLLTNISTVQRFVDREIKCDSKMGAPGTVRIAPHPV